MHHHLRKRIGCLTGALVFGGMLLAGCAPKQNEVVVATIANEPLTLSEYESHYLKSLSTREAGAATSMDERQKFLDLIVKYRLKLAGAYKEGLNTKPEVVNEIEAYKGSLASSYLTEREVMAPGIKKLYARKSEEIRASHILLTVTPEASPADSARAYAKAVDIIAQAKAGKDFSTLAMENSQDPSVKQNGGDLYYFSAGQLVGPFEDAVFSMSPGQISSVPVRTQYGFHIIKVLDRKPSPGDIRAGHIMIRFANQNPSPEDTLKAYKRIEMLHDSLKAGIDFADLARRNSEDPGSAPRGGDLGFFARRRWVQPFDEVAFRMKPGQLSDIVRTVYGYHIIKCFEIHPPKSFEESKADLLQLYQQLRFQDDYARFFESVKKEMKYARIDSSFMRLLASLDTTKTTHDSSWSQGVPPPVRQLPLLSVQGHPVSVDSALALIKARPDMSNISLHAQSVSGTIDKIGEQLTFSAKADMLAKEVPEFASLLKEYREGILLYQVEQEHVWNRVAIGDSVLMIYFNANRDKFVWPDRVNFTEIKASTDTLARTIRRMIAGGKSIEKIATEDSVRMAVPVTYQTVFAKGSSALDVRAQKALATMAAEMKRDRALRLTLTVHPDTSKSRERTLKIGSDRLAAAQKYLVKNLRADASLISTFSVPLSPRELADKKAGNLARGDAMDAYLSGRVPLVLGRPETALLPPAADERSQKADSLTTGGYSAPFLSKGSFLVLRLNGREKARRKTLEEAGAELSSAYQEHESKRLEDEWLTGLRREFPVVENTAALKNAFAPAIR